MNFGLYTASSPCVLVGASQCIWMCTCTLCTLIRSGLQQVEDVQGLGDELKAGLGVRGKEESNVNLLHCSESLYRPPLKRD